MSRRIHLLNLVGVLVLATLCAYQWRANRGLNLDVNRLEKIRIEQTAHIAAQDKTIKGQAADLDLFRSQLEQTRAELHDALSENAALERRLAQVTDENENLKTAIAEWAAAVAARDERIVEANQRIEEFAGRLDDSIRKFNDLAADYNDVVRQLNEARAREANAPKDAP